MVGDEAAPAPIAKKIPERLVAHGDVRVDNYFWMKNRADPDMMSYVKAENSYTEEVTKHTKAAQATLFKELSSRIPETDSTVPDKIDEYYYYTRTEKGRQYPIYCRKRGSLEAPEEIILDVNDIAVGHDFFSVDVLRLSPDHRYLAYLVDTTGAERHDLIVKDLGTGELLPDRIANTSNMEWANDNRTFFYSVMDDEFRPYKVYRHALGTPASSDVEVYHERDRMFYYMLLNKSKTKQFIFITTVSATTSEVSYLDADRPLEPPKVLRARVHGVRYFATHHGDRFLILTNEDAPNFKLMEAPTSTPSHEHWRELIPHRDNAMIMISDPQAFLETFRDYLVVYEMEDALAKIRVIQINDWTSHYVPLPEPIYALEPVENKEFDSTRLRFAYSSLVTPTTIYDYDMKTRKLEALKRLEVSGHDPTRYDMKRVWAEAKDGTKIPLDLVHKKGLMNDANNPCLLYGYGAYGDFEGPMPYFDPNWLSLVDRGFVCARAHIRGGGDMGKRWHEQGRMLNKRNTFTDFIACAECLTKEGYTSRDRLVIRGKSAGGLLVGASTTMRPDLFKVVIAEVPFVDAVSSMQDDKMPLTAGEYEEWGNPSVKEFYEYMKAYSPYDNIRRTAYPNMVITGALNDSRVQYFEPLKFIAKLREHKTDDNVVILRMRDVEGHSGASGRYEVSKYTAFLYAFIFDRLGIEA